MNRNGVFLLTLVVLVSGCKQYEWRSNIRSSSDFSADNYKCQLESAQMYPPVMQTVTYGTGYTTNSTTTCTGDYQYRQCTTTPGKYVPPRSNQVDANQNNRNSAYNACMNAIGWGLYERQ